MTRPVGPNQSSRGAGIRVWIRLVAMAAALGMTAPAVADQADLTDLSIEELMGIKVTSVSKKEHQLSDSAAAIFVITNDDLRRSGVTNIADALRMVPGLNVARLDANKWAINSRGPASRFADKLLVLIDGRSVYTPTFSGVYWEIQDLMLEDVERIEVIRGPGATLWGANAVNGVINVITKPAADTQGGLVTAGGGSHERAFASVRYGMAWGDTVHGRLYAKGFERGEYAFPDGTDAGDDWGMRQGGFRIDADIKPGNSLTLQGDLYRLTGNQQLVLPSLTAPYATDVADSIEGSGGNLLARWQRILSSTSEMALQIYYDSSERKEAVVGQNLQSVDVDFQHNLQLGERHDIIWGARYRRTTSDFENTPVVTVEPDSRSDDLYSAFLQDEMKIVPDRLWLTLGAKIEHNDYTGWEAQPSLRLLWSPVQTHRWWAAVSRAVRTPSRAEADGRVVNAVVPPMAPLTPPIVPVAQGNDQYASEELITYELGYRFIPRPDLSLDLALFYNNYENLRSLADGPLIYKGTYVEKLLLFTNGSSTDTHGAELALAWQASDWLKMDFAYSYLQNDQGESLQSGKAPRHKLSLRSSVSPRSDVDIDLWIRYVDEATGITLQTQDFFYTVDPYLTADLRLAWRPIPDLELSVVGQNLLDDGHFEFAQEAWGRPTEIQRGVYGKITFRF